MDLHLKDKVALVTGGSGGLGKAVCLALAAEGAKVAVNYRRHRENAEAVVKEIKERHAVEALAVAADVAVEAEVIEMYRHIDDTLGEISVLVNNAAVCPTGPITDISPEEWNHTLQVNLTGTFLASRELIRRLLAGGRPGRIVNISSQAAFRGSTSGHAPYDASKGAIVAFTTSLAREVAHHQIAVNAVAPGMMFTEMTRRVLTENEEKYINRIPLRRIAGTEEIADVVVFLASDRASYMTGATVDVSGGMLMR